MIEIEKINKLDFYDMYVLMCKAHNFPALHVDNIDEVYVQFKENTLTYSIFLYNKGSGMCLLGFPLSNLSVSSIFREGCLDKLFVDMEEICKKKGYNLIWTVSATDRVIESLESNGYRKGDESVQTYIKVVS